MEYDAFLHELLEQLPKRDEFGLSEEDIAFYPDGFKGKEDGDEYFVRDTNIMYHRTESNVLIGDCIQVFMPEDHAERFRLSCKNLFEDFSKKGWERIWEIIRSNLDRTRHLARTGIKELLEENNYEVLRSRLIIRAVNFNEHRFSLKGAIYRKIGDMALVLYVLVDDWREGERRNLTSAKMRRELSEQWGLEEDDIFEKALGNTYMMAPPRMYFSALDVTDPPYERGAFMALNSQITTIQPSQVPIVTTTSQMNGAIAMFYPGVMEKIAEMIGGDYYVAFTSMHEARIHKVGTISPVEVARRIKHVNKTINKSEGQDDALTSKVYLYEQKTGKLRVKEA